MRNLEGSNWLGLWTLYMREVRRFMKVYTQTLLAPIVTTLLFLAIFALALGRAVESVHGVPYLQFLAPGLVMMAVAQNAFANTSSSIVIAKVPWPRRSPGSAAPSATARATASLSNRA